MNQTTLFGIAVVPSIIGLVEIAKDVGVPQRFSPLVALAIGILAGLAQVFGLNLSWVQGITAGVGFGLAAVGLHAGGKAIGGSGGGGPANPPATIVAGAGDGQGATDTHPISSPWIDPTP